MNIGLNNVKNSIQDYVDWTFWIIFLSTALIFQHILKICFNIWSNLKIGIDKWTILDTLSASLNIIAVVIIYKSDPQMFLETQRKDLIDYFMLLVLTVSWLRFFSYFLVVREISKLLLTLIEMIGDTLSFLFIVSCFILIMSSIFATLYQDNYPDKYGGLAKTVTTLFNGVVAQYWYDDIEMKGRVISHSMLTIFHVFFTNIILMNYLIAILSSTYSKMKQSGIFSFKVNLYQYCERFFIAFKDRDYGELVMHPPPLSFISGILLLFVWSRPLIGKVSKMISLMMFWFENIFYVLFFFIFEILISPLAYMKVWYNLMLMLRTTGTGTISFFKSLIYCMIWAFLGPILMTYIISMDIIMFL
jgi:Ion transport protein